jgi:hypothetical protein
VSTALLDRSRVEIKLADYGTAPATALDDGQLLGRVQDYRRGTAARLYPLEGSEIVQKIPAAEFHVSRKLDGEFTVLVFRQGESFTLNPGGTVRVGLPFLEEAARLLSKAGVKEALIAGELYVAREDRRTRVHDIVSMAGKPAAIADLESIHFGAFEIISLNGSPPPAAFRDSWGQLTKLLQSGNRIRPVEANWVNKPDAIRDLYSQWVEKEGAEGLVVRSTAAGSFKIKPRHNLDVAVVGFAESAGDRTGLLHDMLVAVLRREGTFHVLGRVGGGFTDEQRKEMLSDLKDMVVHSEYAEVSADHVAYQMVKPEWVIEISCLDLVAQNTRGGPVNRMVLDWHANNGHSLYKTLRRLPLASVISPQFVRRRDDKQVQPTDVRIAQVANLVELPYAEKDSRQMVLPKSEILRREVYVKELKGETMIRKLLLWKTNKEQATDDYPAYVVHLTDFSPNRKDPLAREMRISSSFEQIQQLFDGLKAENITKGWNLHAKTETMQTAIAAPVVVAPSSELMAPVAVATESAPAESETPAPKRKAARKFVESETAAPEKPKTPRKKKSS